MQSYFTGFMSDISQFARILFYRLQPCTVKNVLPSSSTHASRKTHKKYMEAIEDMEMPLNHQHWSLWKMTRVKTTPQSYSRNIHSGRPNKPLSTWRTELNMSKFSSMKRTTAWTTPKNYKPILCYLFTGLCNNKRIKYNKSLIFVFSCSYC